MLWFKHFSNNSTQNQSFMGLSNELGAEGYGRLMLLIECLVGGADGIDHAPSAKLKVNVWATILKCKPKKVRTFLECCQNHGIINFVHLENEIEVTLLNHRKLLSKSALPSGKRTPNDQPLGDQEENRKEQNSSFSSSQRNDQSFGQSNLQSNQSTFGSTDQSMPPINVQENKDIEKLMFTGH